jgi:hypothetical protein
MPQTDMPVLRNGYLYLVNQPPIAVDTAAWFAWLTQANRFCYRPVTSTYRVTLRKEKRRHGCYWYAYLKNDRKLHNAYAGRTPDLTRQRLQQVFSSLMDKVALQREMQRYGST